MALAFNGNKKKGRWRCCAEPHLPFCGTLKFFALALLVCEFEDRRALCKNRKFLNKFEIIAFSDFFIAINKPFERKNIGYAGKINAQIFKYLEPNSITTGSLEKKLIIRSDNMYKNIPDTIIIRNEYFIEVKYVSLTLSKFLAPKF